METESEEYRSHNNTESDIEIQEKGLVVIQDVNTVRSEALGKTESHAVMYASFSLHRVTRERSLWPSLKCCIVFLYVYTCPIKLSLDVDIVSH